jgi:hypothetical protein
VLRRLTYRWVSILVALAVLSLATTAIAHGHSSGKSVDEPHCGICMASHTGAHVLVPPVTSLQYAPAVAALDANTAFSTFAYRPSRTASDRAPPHI